MTARNGNRCPACRHPKTDHKPEIGCTAADGVCFCGLDQFGDAPQARARLRDGTSVLLGEYINGWDSNACEACGSRSLNDGTVCCGQPMTPVRVTLTRREVTP
jgi:hypothetical protein